jgi:hypothetical protein
LGKGGYKWVMGVEYSTSFITSVLTPQQHR